jgi:hypothetical protein
VIFNNIDQTVLDTFGSEDFGAVSDELGIFTHSFTFTTSEDSKGSSSVVTIQLRDGSKDIDFTSIDLDGWAFTQHIFDPDAETWDLNTVLLPTGSHTITLHGSVVAGPAASYGGTLNIQTVPEPATWAMMIMGFGGLGAVMRRRRSLLSAVA